MFLIQIAFLLLTCWLWPASSITASNSSIYVAHAGGRADNLRYTNSLEALNSSYDRGYRYFEIDLAETTDGQLVLMHDWDISVHNLFGLDKHQLSFKEFKTKPMDRGRLTALSFNDFYSWFTAHPDTRIILDTKFDQAKIFASVASGLTTEDKKRFIPQISSVHDYAAMRHAGYEDIVLTLYANDYSTLKTIVASKIWSFWSITYDLKKAKDSDLTFWLRLLGEHSCVHLVNTEADNIFLSQRGIDCFYSSDLNPVSID